MYPQPTNLSPSTSNPPKPTSIFQPSSTDKSTESSPQSSLPCGQRTPAASTSSSDCKVLLLTFRWSFVCLVLLVPFISFAIVPEVSITLVMH